MNHKKDPLRIRLCGAWSGLILAFLIIAGSEFNAQAAATGARITISGKVVSVKGSELVVATPGGNVKLTMSEKTAIRGEVLIKLSDIRSGMYLGTTATKQSSGNFLASEVHVFPEDQRGTGEGHRWLSSAPQSGATMTNGNVERVKEVTVQHVKGRLMIVKYRGGEVNVLVPPNIPIVKRVPGNRASLKPGAEIRIQATHGSGDTLTASQITVRAITKRKVQAMR